MCPVLDIHLIMSKRAMVFVLLGFTHRETKIKQIMLWSALKEQHSITGGLDLS